MEAKGCFTLDKFIHGRSLSEIERILGFQRGRLSQGGQVLALMRLPSKDEFRLAGYSNVSLNRFVMAGGLDIDVLKRNAIETWELTCPNRLVKVAPTIPHNPKLKPKVQYPDAAGAPQWDVLTSLPCVVLGTLSGYPDGVYRHP